VTRDQNPKSCIGLRYWKLHDLNSNESLLHNKPFSSLASLAIGSLLGGSDSGSVGRKNCFLKDVVNSGRYMLILGIDIVNGKASLWTSVTRN